MNRRGRRRGVTLVELIVYISLVSAGVLLIGGVELFAQRCLHLQQSLIEVELQTAGFGGQLRRDVEEARALTVDGDRLQLVTLGGETVRYLPGGRELLDAAGEVAQRDEFPEVAGCSFTLERLASGRMRVTAAMEFKVLVDGEERTRTRTRSAVTRLAVPE